MESNINIVALKEEIDKSKQQKNYQQCLKLIEDNIQKLTDKYSKDSPEYYSIAETICELCYETALDYYSMGKPDEGLKYLDKCSKMFINYKAILNVCYTNQGHFFRKMNQIDKALTEYDKAINVSTELSNKKGAALGHLNYANAILPLGKVQLAIEQGLAGIILLQEEIIDDESKKGLYDEFLIEAYCFVAFAKEKLGNKLESLLFYDLADKMLKQSKSNSNNSIIILSAEEKYNMIQSCLLKKKNESLKDKNEKMASAYIKE